MISLDLSIEVSWQIDRGEKWKPFDLLPQHSEKQEQKWAPRGCYSCLVNSYQGHICQTRQRHPIHKSHPRLDRFFHWLQNWKHLNIPFVSHLPIPWLNFYRALPSLHDYYHSITARSWHHCFIGVGKYLLLVNWCLLTADSELHHSQDLIF